MDKVQKIREEVERLKSNLIHGACASQIAMETRCKEEAYEEVISLLDSLQEKSASEDLEDPCSCCQGFCNKEKCDELIFGYRCPVLNVIQSLELGFENAVEKASEWLKDFCNEHYIMSYTDSSEVVYEKLIEIFKNKMKEDK